MYVTPIGRWIAFRCCVPDDPFDDGALVCFGSTQRKHVVTVRAHADAECECVGGTLLTDGLIVICDRLGCPETQRVGINAWSEFVWSERSMHVQMARLAKWQADSVGR